MQEVTAFSLKRNHESSANMFTPDSKRMKLNTNAKTQCHYCHKMGHKANECRARIAKMASTSRAPTPTMTEKPVTCYQCGERGHISPHCPKRAVGARSGGDGAASSSGVAIERRVNFCEVKGVRGTLQQSGESYPFYFDSGAECSLVRQSIADKFLGTRAVTNVRLTGVGNAHVYCTEQISCEITINNHCFCLTFLILPDDNLPHDIMIGSDILNLGLTVNLSSACLIVSKPVVNCFSPNVEIDFSAIDCDIPPTFKDSLPLLLTEFSFAFIEGLPHTRVTTGDIKIRLKDPTITVYRRPYRLSPHEREVVRAKVNELLSAKIIQPSSSPYASPILLVKKKDGSDRMVIDYRELNSNTIPDRFLLPRIDDQIARLHGANYFTCLDCARGFNQIPILDPESIERTAFITPEGQFEYLAMPFGLRNAPSVFQRAVSKALGSLCYSYAISFADDILIPSQSVEEGLSRLRF